MTTQTRWRPTLEVVRSMRGDLVRLAVVVALTAGLTLALGMIFPAQYALDTAAYRHTAARTEAPVVASASDAAALSQSLGGARVALMSIMLTELRSPTGSIDMTEMLVMSNSDADQSMTFMPPATLAAAAAPVGPRWMDVSSDIAAALHARPGDTVEVRVGPEKFVSLTIRGVYGVRETGFKGLAQVPAAALAGEVEASALAPTQVLTDAEPWRVTDVLNTSPWAEGLSHSGYAQPFAATPVADLLTTAEQQSRANLGLIFAVSAIALLALLGIAVRETLALAQEFSARAALFHDLGVGAATLRRTLAGAALTCVMFALVAGGGLGYLAYSLQIVAPTLPLELVPAWWGAVAFAVVACGVTAVQSARRVVAKATP
ncbi:hypothetical protein JT358_00800 [Micrococcales bacterium 31B]|nr:hypothetical protein [Micrococcales bacterium 31B]